GYPQRAAVRHQAATASSGVVASCASASIPFTKQGSGNAPPNVFKGSTTTAVRGVRNPWSWQKASSRSLYRAFTEDAGGSIVRMPKRASADAWLAYTAISESRPGTSTSMRNSEWISSRRRITVEGGSPGRGTWYTRSNRSSRKQPVSVASYARPTSETPSPRAILRARAIATPGYGLSRPSRPVTATTGRPLARESGACKAMLSEGREEVVDRLA